MKPRSYSTLVNGRIIWVDPGDPPPIHAAEITKTMRLETDEEVRERLRIVWRSQFGANGNISWIDEENGYSLDVRLKEYGLKPRMKDIVEP